MADPSANAKTKRPRVVVAAFIAGAFLVLGPSLQRAVEMTPWFRPNAPVVEFLHPTSGVTGGRELTVVGTADPVDANVWLLVTGDNTERAYLVGGYPIRPEADGTWSASIKVGSIQDDGATFVLTAQLLDDAGTAAIASTDPSPAIAVKLTELPEPIAEARVVYRRSGE